MCPSFSLWFKLGVGHKYSWILDTRFFYPNKVYFFFPSTRIEYYLPPALYIGFVSQPNKMRPSKILWWPCPTHCNPMGCSLPASSVLHYFLEFSQTRVPWVSDAIPPSHPLLLTTPLALILSQHQGLFQWAGSLNQVAKVFGISASVLPMNIQGWFPLGLTVLMSLQTKELSKVFSSSTIQKHNSSQFNPLYGLILTCVHDYWKYQALTIQSFVNKVMSLLFSILSCFVKAFLSRSKHLLLSWVHS